MHPVAAIILGAIVLLTLLVFLDARRARPHLGRSRRHGSMTTEQAPRRHEEGQAHRNIQNISGGF